MGALGYIWGWLMLMGGVRAHLTHALPRELVWAMIISGVIALLLLWNRNSGVFAAYAPSGIVRAGLAILILVAAGIAHPAAVMDIVSL